MSEEVRFHHASGDPERGESGQGLTRAVLLRRAAGGGAAALLTAPGSLVRELLDSGRAGATPATAAPSVQGFVSRPDLRPPIITVRHAAHAAAPGHLFLAPSAGPGQRGALIADNEGEPIWFRPSTPLTTMDFRVSLYRGAPLLSWWEGKHVKGVGKVGSYVIFDSGYREIARFGAGPGVTIDFHEFLLTPQGTALVTANEIAPANLASVGGRKHGRVLDGIAREIDVGSGRVLFEWRSLDHVPVTESYARKVGDPHDYFHINAIDLDVDGNLLIGARNTWTVYKVERGTGRVIWRLGGRKSDFAMGAGTRFAYQHDCRSHVGGRQVTLFDNGPDPYSRKPESSALTLRLDVDRKRATLVRRLRHSPPLYARITGNQQVLPNGNAVVCWGSTGAFTEYGADGTVRFDATLPDRGQNYRVFRFPWIGRPTEPPTLVARSEGGVTRLYTSWNGATEVASWELRTGRRASALTTTLRQPRQGFETSLPAPPGTAYAEAVALDKTGKPIGRSRPIAI
jgi:hypothetical protein